MMTEQNCPACGAEPVKHPVWANVIQWWCGSFKYLDGMQAFGQTTTCSDRQKKENEMSDEKCPKCGAAFECNEIIGTGPIRLVARFACGTFRGMDGKDCLRRQLAKKDAELEQAKAACVAIKMWLADDRNIEAAMQILIPGARLSGCVAATVYRNCIQDAIKHNPGQSILDEIMRLRTQNADLVTFCEWAIDEAHKHVSEVDGSPDTFAGQVLGHADAALALAPQAIEKGN